MICVTCLEPTAAIKYDKKGHPYVSCPSCQMKMFLRNDYAGVARYAAIAQIMEEPGMVDRARAMSKDIMYQFQIRAQSEQLAGSGANSTINQKEKVSG